MVWMLVSVVEFNQLSGTIEYYCEIDSVKSQDEEISETHIEKFYTLKELLNLTTREKMEEIKNSIGATRVNIDAICFNSKTADEKIEFLLMSDAFFGQSISILGR